MPQDETRDTSSWYRFVSVNFNSSGLGLPSKRLKIIMGNKEQQDTRFQLAK